MIYIYIFVYYLWPYLFFQGGIEKSGFMYVLLYL